MKNKGRRGRNSEGGEKVDYKYSYKAGDER
jgi:hypothetical protein